MEMNGKIHVNYLQFIFSILRMTLNSKNFKKHYKSREREKQPKKGKHFLFSYL